MPKKYCYTAIEGQCDKNGYIPSAVFEGEKSHRPMTGQGVGASPWYWGKTLKECQELCDEKNEQLGISKDEALMMVGRSMFPRAEKED